MYARLISLLACSLCLCASFAFAKGDPGDGSQSGLDVYFPGMTMADAKKSGATAAGKNAMKATVTWGGKKWDVRLLLKGKDIAVVGLSAKLTGNDQVLTMLQDMQERLAVPMVVTRMGDGEKNELNFAELAVAGKDTDARDGALKDALSTYASQEKGSITITFCPEAMFEEMAKAMKATGHIAQKAIMAGFGDSIVYSLHMDKKDDSITVVASTFADIGKF